MAKRNVLECIRRPENSTADTTPSRVQGGESQPGSFYQFIRHTLLDLSCHGMGKTCMMSCVLAVPTDPSIFKPRKLEAQIAMGSSLELPPIFQKDFHTMFA